MSNHLKPATIDDVKRIAKEVKEMADEVTKETNRRIVELEKEAKVYAKQNTLKRQSIFRRFFK